MPKGVIKIKWTPENETKLLLAIIAVHNIKVDNNAVAKAFGDDIPGLAISSHMCNVRKRAAKLGLTPSFGTPALAKSSTRAPAATKTNPQKRTANTMLDGGSEDDESMASGSSQDDHNDKRYRTAPTTPSRQTTIAGQITKPRVSPRNLAKKDYKALENPYAGNETYDADGNDIFESSASDANDDNGDDEYDRSVVDMVKMEDGAGS